MKVTLHKTGAHAVSSARPFPLSLYGVTLGLAGIGGSWVAAHAVLGAPGWPEEIFYGLSFALWLAFTVIYVGQRVRRVGAFKADLEHPGSGPFTAFIPAVGILLSSHYAQYSWLAGRWATIALVAILSINVAQLVAHWLAGNLEVDLLHGGYFIPVVAGPFIASIGFSTVGLHEAAITAFGAGIFFWLSFGTIVMNRHMTGAKLSAPMAPTPSAFLAAPASAAVAWIIAHPGPEDEVLMILTGVLFIMLLVQLVMIKDYRTIPFTLSFWIFAFPAASTTNFVLRWLATTGYAGWRVWAWAALAATTIFVLGIGVASVRVAIAAAARARGLSPHLAASASPHG